MDLLQVYVFVALVNCFKHELSISRLVLLEGPSDISLQL